MRGHWSDGLSCSRSPSGPVQEFIAAGRKTRDLWFGSHLLSELSRAAARNLQESGATLIFPDPRALDEATPVANKLLAIVPDGMAARRAADAREATRRELLGYRQEFAIDVNKHGLGEAIDWELLDLQLIEFPEWFAAWHPFPEGQYQESRDNVERLLAGRKALRDFAPAHGRSTFKSSIDPGRETVIVSRHHKHVEQRLRLKAGEELDGISLIKRRYGNERFVSISRVAIDPFIRRIADDPRLEGLKTLADHLKGSDASEFFKTEPGSGLEQYHAFPYDSQLFYDRVELGANSPEQHKQSANEFQQLVAKLQREHGIGELPAHVAVLVADGDRMGEAISKLPNAEANQDFSASLREFATNASRITRDHQGAPVYTGGDDVLAFLPVDTALACAAALRREFAARMGDGLTLSVGIAIAHYAEHLQNLIQWGRDAEHAAKGSRNALAVSLHTRSGGELALSIVHSWADDPIDRRWNQWINWYRQGLIPTGTAYELRQLAREFGFKQPRGRDDAPLADDVRNHLLQLEARRILKRKRIELGSGALSDEQLGILTAMVTDPKTLGRLADELSIARRIAATMEVAEGTVERRADPVATGVAHA